MTMRTSPDAKKRAEIYQNISSDDEVEVLDFTRDSYKLIMAEGDVKSDSVQKALNNGYEIVVEKEKEFAIQVKE